MGNNLLYNNFIKPHINNKDPFLIYRDGSFTTYKEFISLSKKISQYLVSSQVAKGDRILFQLEKSIYGLAVYVACIMTGAIYVPLNDQYTLEETKYFINDSKPKFVFCSSGRKNEIEKLNIVSQDSLVEIDPKIGFLKFNIEEYEELTFIQAVDINDIIAFLYTSGTTGKSKAVALSQGNLYSNASTLKVYWDIQKNDRLIHMLPIFHTHGLFVAINTTLLSGLSVYFFDKFSLTDLITVLPKATLLMGVPTYYKRMNGSSLVTKNLTNNMRLFISGSAPLSSIDHQMFYQKTGHTILERYGMTETNMNTSNPYLGKRKPGSVGLPLPQVHIRIIDDNSKKQMGINEIGMIQIKGPNVFNSYWNNDQANQEAFSDDGFFITGDLGYIDEDGYITISGREKDLIISGGFNIYPKEIEDLINDYEEVIESAVIGKNDTDLGEVPVAIIVIGSKLREKIITELNKRFIKNLAKYKIPKEIKIINELPRNAMGKIQKNKIFDLIS